MSLCVEPVPQANGISVAAGGGGSLLKGAVRWLDRGINRLIGGDSGAASAASSDDEFDGHAASGHRRRATADVARMAPVGVAVCTLRSFPPITLDLIAMRRQAATCGLLPTSRR